MQTGEFRVWVLQRAARVHTVSQRAAKCFALEAEEKSPEMVCGSQDAETKRGAPPGPLTGRMRALDGTYLGRL